MLVSLVLANKCHVVDWLKDLPAPFVVDGRSLREACACPVLEFVERRARVSLTDFVVPATDDHVVVILVTFRETHVLVDFRRVVEQTVFNGTFGYANCNTIS